MTIAKFTQFYDVTAMVQKIGQSNKERHPEDFYSTSSEAVEYLIQFEKFHYRIIEPACGMGHISEVLIEAGYQVSSFDLIDRGYGLGGVDFLTSPLYDNVKGQADIVTNCPYSIAFEFLSRALEITHEKVAFLFPLEYIGRCNWCKHLQHVYVFARKIDIAKDGDFESYHNRNMKHYAWLVFNINYKGEPTIRTIKNIKTEKQLIEDLRYKYLDGNYYDINEVEIKRLAEKSDNMEINSLIVVLNGKGLSNRHISRLLSISEGKVRYQLKKEKYRT